MPKAVYKAKDDSEHDTKVEAEKRDQLVDAGRQLESSVPTISRLLTEGGKTADGQLLDLGSWKTYYFIRRGYGSMPRLQEFSLWPHNLGVDFDRDDGALIVRQFESDRRSGGEYVSIKVNDLYADQTKAEDALLLAIDQHVKDVATEAEEMRKCVELQRKKRR